jgi:hypothetical protein
MCTVACCVCVCVCIKRPRSKIIGLSVILNNPVRKFPSPSGEPMGAIYSTIKRTPTRGA